MPKPRINGTLNPVRQPTEYTYDPQNGMQVVFKWEAAGGDLWPLANAYAAARMGFTHIPNAAKSTLIATASGPQAGEGDFNTDTWEILANEIQKDMLEHPRSLAIEESFPGTLILVKHETESGKALATTPPWSSGAVALGATRLYNLLVRGQTHFSLGQYVLRHTTNVSNAYNSNIADFNVERIYTTAQLLTEAGNSNLWTFPLPGRLAYKVQNLPVPTARTDYLVGWRKLPSSENTAANNRVNITTEYWLEQWSLYAYDPV